MADLPPQFRTVLDGAQAEAKRHGHARVTEAHVALSLLRRHPKETQACWGSVTEAWIVERHLANVERGDAVAAPSAELLALFQSAVDQPDRLAALCRSIAEALQLPADPQETAGGPPSSKATSSVAPETAAERAGETSPSTGASGKVRLTDPDGARAFLRSRIVGQDEVIESLIGRLVVTRSDLDLKPERPDGVFLFAGPTGVGKTELAKALGEYLAPTPGSFIRLDMSEYRWGFGVSRLIGSGPGYVGYNEPSGWLTTRIKKSPDGVLLLDEIEKADPEVWRVFLQVFDDGRLTDCRGVTAEFANIVVVMTTNLGARAYDQTDIGFPRHGDVPSSVAGDVLKEVRRVLPIELYNRIDEVVVFRALDRDDLFEIARRLVRATCQHLQPRGYDLEVDDAAVGLVARQDYDPALGARHMMRNLERMILAQAAVRGPGKYHLTVEADELSWITPDEA